MTGIHPFNTNIFGEEEFLSSNVTDRPMPHTSTSGFTSREDMEVLEPLPSTSGLKNLEKEADLLSLISRAGEPVLTISPLMIRPFPKASLQTMAKGGRKKDRRKPPKKHP